MITKQDIQAAAASYIFRSSFVSEDQARKVTIRAGNNATKNLVKTFRGKLFKKAFGRARRGKDISSFERQEKEKVVLIFFIILIMVVCEAVIL